MSRLATIQEQLLHVDAMIAQLEQNAVRVPKPSTLANIRALEKERRSLQTAFEGAAQEADVDIYRYKILNRDRATIEGLTQAWGEFQRLLSTVYRSLVSGSGTKKKTRKEKKTEEPAAAQLELGFAYAFPGSIGVALTLPNKTQAALFADDKIKEATETIFDFARSHEDQAKVHTFVRRLGPEPVAAMYRWVETHVVHHYGVEIEWRRTEQDSRSVLVQFEQMEVLQAELSQATIDTTITVDGEISILNLEEMTFRIRTDDDQIIDGAFTDAINQEHRAQLPGRFSAKIIKRTKIVEGPNGEQEVTYFLESVEPL